MPDSLATTAVLPPPAAHCPSALEALDEDGRREYWAALALRWTRDLSSLDAAKLLRHFGSAYAALQNIPHWPDAGVPLRKAAHYRDESWRKKARPEWDSARTLKGRIVLWTDRHYPAQLKEVDAAPALLYAVGDLSLLNAPCVAIVGSRKCSQTAQDFADIIAEDLSKAGVTVVSGLAFGIDGRAQRSALRGTGRTIAVLGGGVDVPYPATHTELFGKVAESGLLVSEFPPGMKPRAGFFPVRNRIISGLSLGVLVVEALSEKSGSLITARLAAEQGRNVYVPAPDALHGLYAEGTKKLLMDGAFPIYRADDLLADLMPHLRQALNAMSSPKRILEKETPVPPASSAPCPAEPEREHRPTPSESPLPSPGNDEDALLALLHAAPLCPDDLLLALQEDDGSWNAPRMLSALMMLEVKGQVRRLADSRYEVRP